MTESHHVHRASTTGNGHLGDFRAEIARLGGEVASTATGTSVSEFFSLLVGRSSRDTSTKLVSVHVGVRLRVRRCKNECCPVIPSSPRIAVAFHAGHQSFGSTTSRDIEPVASVELFALSGTPTWRGSGIALLSCGDGAERGDRCRGATVGRLDRHPAR